MHGFFLASLVFIISSTEYSHKLFTHQLHLYLNFYLLFAIFSRFTSSPTFPLSVKYAMAFFIHHVSPANQGTIAPIVPLPAARWAAPRATASAMKIKYCAILLKNGGYVDSLIIQRRYISRKIEQFFKAYFETSFPPFSS